MIHIVMDGMCEGCDHAELEVGCNDYGAIKEWGIRCVHDIACFAMRKKCGEDENNEDNT